MAQFARVEIPQDTPERILSSSLEVFSERGFEGARTREIAARACVPLGLLQYHFGNKDELWRATVERAFEDLDAGIEKVLAESEPTTAFRDELARVIRAYVGFVSEHTAFIRIMHDEGKRRGQRMRWLADGYVKPLYDKVMVLILRAQQEGLLLAEVHPAHFVYILVGAVGMIFHQAEECKRVVGMDPTDPSTIEAHSRAVESLFLRPAHPETS